MSWIDTIDEEGAEGELADLYRKWAEPKSGKVDNILKIHALHPAGLRGHGALYEAVMRGTRSLRKAEREMIALVVSRLNRCHY